MGLSIIVASSGRPTLARTLLSIAPQLEPGDELLVDVNEDAPWGHAARNRQMARATGSHLLFMDDDDMYLEGALKLARTVAAWTPSRVHIFRMRYPDQDVIWREHEVELGNVSTIMLMVPNEPGRLGEWGDRYEGDFDFLTSTLELRGDAPVWHEDVIAAVRP